MIIKTPIAAKCFYETANPLSDARYPFTLQAKPSINIKNNIDNGNFDYSEGSKIRVDNLFAVKLKVSVLSSNLMYLTYLHFPQIFSTFVYIRFDR